jgi:hypothetical protein
MSAFALTLIPPTAESILPVMVWALVVEKINDLYCTYVSV